MNANGLRYHVHCGDALQALRSLPSESAQTCITSPPYWGLRDYGHAGQMGMEETPDAYVAGMVAVFREVRRVLRADGTLWLNLGDSYAVRWGSKRAEGRAGMEDNVRQRGAAVPAGLKEKDLAGIPWRVAFALQADGWTLRSDIVWHKPNPMPESVRDRPTRAHEFVFLLAKGPRYFYDADAVMEPAVKGDAGAGARNYRPGTEGNQRKREGQADKDREWRNRRTVWTVAPKPFKGAHFAVMPEALVEPCVLAGSRPGDTVIDPFTGSGTVGVVALRHGRRFFGVELNPEYAQMARERIGGDAPLLAREGAA